MCNAGFAGVILATRVNPFFIGSCTVAAYVPTNTVAMWTGLVASIPAGWIACNGSRGTPDLRGRFVVGAGPTYVASLTGGRTSVSLTSNELPAHTHGASSSFTGDNLPTHNHGVNDVGHQHAFRYAGPAAPVGYTVIGSPTTQVINGVTQSSNETTPFTFTSGNYQTRQVSLAAGQQPAGITLDAISAGRPTGSVTTTVNSAGNGAAFDILPPYFALVYICKL